MSFLQVLMRILMITELLAGDDSDSLDTVISGSDVDDFFETAEDTPAM